MSSNKNDGLLEMMDAMSQAPKPLASVAVDRREEATGGQGEIRGLDWDDNEDAWIDEIARNIEGLLATDKGLVIERQVARSTGQHPRPGKGDPHQEGS